MESNMTVTIFSEEYRDLIKTNAKYDLLMGLLMESTELDYRDELRVYGGMAGEYLKQLEPMAYSLRLDELRKAKYWEEGGENNDEGADR